MEECNSRFLIHTLRRIFFNISCSAHKDKKKILNVTYFTLSLDVTVFELEKLSHCYRFGICYIPPRFYICGVKITVPQSLKYGSVCPYPGFCYRHTHPLQQWFLRVTY